MFNFIAYSAEQLCFIMNALLSFSKVTFVSIPKTKVITICHKRKREERRKSVTQQTQDVSIKRPGSVLLKSRVVVSSCGDRLAGGDGSGSDSLSKVSWYNWWGGHCRRRYGVDGLP